MTNYVLQGNSILKSTGAEDGSAIITTLQSKNLLLTILELQQSLQEIYGNSTNSFRLEVFDDGSGNIALITSVDEELAHLEFEIVERN